MTVFLNLLADIKIIFKQLDAAWSLGLAMVHRRIRELHMGRGQIERQRRENRGAVSAYGGVSRPNTPPPAPQDDLGRKFWIFDLEMAHFGGFWGAKSKVSL